MLARFDFAIAPGVYANTAGFVELEQNTPEAFASLILQRHALLDAAPLPAERVVVVLPQDGVERTRNAYDTIEGLRAAVAKFGLHEHVPDMETGTPLDHPELMQATVLGGNRDPVALAAANRRSWLFNGLAMDFKFTVRVHGVGMFYRQGLYPSVFQVFPAKERDHIPFPGRGYSPHIGFFGFAIDDPDDPIDRLIVQSAAMGNVRLLASHFFASTVPNRIYERTP